MRKEEEEKSNQRRRSVVKVVIRKRSRPTKRGVALSRRGGLPVASLSVPPPSPALSTKETNDSVAWLQGDDDDEEEEAVVPSDVLLLMESLLSQTTATSISIPVGSSASIRAILQCQLYDRLDDATVVPELQSLRREGTVRLLSAPLIGGVGQATQDRLEVLVTGRDYVEAVRQACRAGSTQVVVDWFLQHLAEWRTTLFSEADLQKTFQEDPVVGFSFEQAIQALLQSQLLLGQASHGTFQLWVPGWGLVLQAWTKAVGRVRQQLKRSQFKELSIQSLDQAYSPVPTPLVIQWMVTQQGSIEKITRPSGTFARLVPT